MYINKYHIIKLNIINDIRPMVDLFFLCIPYINGSGKLSLIVDIILSMNND